MRPIKPPKNIQLGKQLDSIIQAAAAQPSISNRNMYCKAIYEAAAQRITQLEKLEKLIQEQAEPCEGECYSF